ncbi:ATP-grasp domain-containing protein [Nonomuraea sp. MCN248]|uniref:biotin carboxylase n=1 Tax=Nonomuraea corallina TaxID=2989783 RepID=A0ABT4SHE8_9ACTN|nr:biotin carboxylase N-terminal domain-containing protein [Nonomuraea corallina]MDA0636574.1 ATP-grasp domain-containing protein [Nonomuraea corallina]
MTASLFGRVLVANRGEIAVRVIRTLRALGIGAVAVHTAADAGARHVIEADEAHQIQKYLDIESIVEVARLSGAAAVHPGYGFLAENAAFARRCAEAGLVFVGPPPEAIEAMGDKIRAKSTVSAAGVPVVPGAAEPGDALETWSGFPALIKPSAGGGGKGMVLVRSAAELPDALESARRTATAAFGDGTLLIERYVERPRHIEIQILADGHGHVVHLGERECSLQRRHQKIVEEAPSPFVDAGTRARMGAAAVEAARAVGYVGAGTVEFIVDGATGDYHFMEMNTRLQVEHPVTELVTGLDLVELQLRVAAGEPLPFTQDDVRLDGHAVEARVYAEDPARGFLPTGGRVLALREPAGPGVRVDSGLLEGAVVGSEFDPMLSKVVAWAPDRAGALRALGRALGETVVLGVTTNVPFLRALLGHEAVRAGELDTGLVERVLPDLLPDLLPAGPAASGAERGVPGDALAAAALVFHDRPEGRDPWEVMDGWRVGERAWTTWRLETRDGVHAVHVRGLPRTGAEVRVEDGPPVPARLRPYGNVADGPTAGGVAVTLGGRTTHYVSARDGETLWLGRDGHAWPVTRHLIGDPGDRPGAAGSGDGVVRSPMPGTVLVVKAQVGDQVKEGQALVIVEAMKMEHTVTAPRDGRVAELPAQAGRSVDMDAVLAVVEEA